MYYSRLKNLIWRICRSRFSCERSSSKNVFYTIFKFVTRCILKYLYFFYGFWKNWKLYLLMFKYYKSMNIPTSRVKYCGREIYIKILQTEKILIKLWYLWRDFLGTVFSNFSYGYRKITYWHFFIFRVNIIINTLYDIIVKIVVGNKLGTGEISEEVTASRTSLCVRVNVYVYLYVYVCIYSGTHRIFFWSGFNLNVLFMC